MRHHPFAVLTARAALGLTLGLALFGALFGANPAHAQRVVTIPVNIESDPPGAAVFIDSSRSPVAGLPPPRPRAFERVGTPTAASFLTMSQNDVAWWYNSRETTRFA